MNERRTGILIGFLAALVVGLGVALALVVTGDDSDSPSTTTVTSTATPTTPGTVTSPPPTQTTTPTTPTVPSGPTIDQVQAKAAAQRGASQEAGRMGIGIPAPDWDARCTALGGRAQAGNWTCQVASNGGQCAGTITAVARAPGVAATRNPRIACGE
jgi:cytoskeletal protein RodZ